ncbi:zinc-dependent metalloprotease [Flagellimonas sp.]|uniref:zinc-dependent metalloprotease n=1 Tax=Flagellimonas sp. TaxID=2058762 RepID=UPI003BAEDCDD
MKKNIVLFGLLFICGLVHPADLSIGEFGHRAVGVPSYQGQFLTSIVKEDQLYLDIPDRLLDTPILFTCQDRMRRSYMQVVWSRHGDKILLKRQAVTSTAGIILPLKKGIDLLDNVLAILSIESEHTGQGKIRVNITKLLLYQDLDWPQRFGVSFGNPVPQLSVLLGARNMDGEVVIKARRGMIQNKSKVSVPIFYGFSTLGPPMKARKFDYRMGFYPDEKIEANLGQQNALANITKWRLEKKHRDQKMSVPIRPITFLISPDVPKKWRPYIKAGIEEWLPAFESAGFKDALVVQEMDSLNEWQEHSIHTNMVYWNPMKYLRGSEYEDYGGTIGHIIDLRTGEILRADIFMGASVRTVMERYFVRAAPLDARAHQFPFPDELIGQLFQVIAAHEAGHVFGIMDANFGEYCYPWDKMGDSTWLRTMGHTPSVMNYTRSSNIAQVGDSVPPSLLLQRVGPTDRYNIQWGYSEFPEGTSPDDEKEALERMVRWQDSVPWYRFNKNQMEVIGPASSNEVVETNDPVRSTELALKNVEQVIGLLPKVVKDQNDDGRLKRLYGKTIELWNSHMLHVTSLIGGYDIQYKSLNQQGNKYDPIPWKKQMEALDFIMTHALFAPRWLAEPSFQWRTGYSTFPDKILQYQQQLVVGMLTARRLKRIEFLEANPGHIGSVKDYLERLQAGLFKELWGDFGHVTQRRQEIQLTYLDTVISILEQERAIADHESRYFHHSDYSKGLLMQRLLRLKQEIEKVVEKNKGTGIPGHWQLCLRKINSAL